MNTSTAHNAQDAKGRTLEEQWSLLLPAAKQHKLGELHFVQHFRGRLIAVWLLPETDPAHIIAAIAKREFNQPDEYRFLCMSSPPTKGVLVL